MSASVYVLEGAWEKPVEVPKVLPYLHAYEQSHREVKIFHRTIRNQADVAYYVSKIPKNSRSFVYVACHGQVGLLHPSDKKNQLPVAGVREALGAAKENSIAFLHFGCCEFVQPAEGSRRRFLSDLANSVVGGLWVSGYTREVDWLPSTLFDLALISEVYVPWRRKPNYLAAARKRAATFVESYEQLARSLGFSALYRVGKAITLFPPRVT